VVVWLTSFRVSMLNGRGRVVGLCLQISSFALVKRYIINDNFDAYNMPLRMGLQMVNFSGILLMDGG